MCRRNTPAKGKEPGPEDPILRGFVCVKSWERQNYRDRERINGGQGRAGPGGRGQDEQQEAEGTGGSWECSVS